MKKLFAILSFLLLAAAPARAQLGTIQGFCDNGGNHALTSGQPSSNYLQGNIPLCTVSVFYHDTTTLAPIFMGENSTGTLKSVQVTNGGSYSVCPTGVSFSGGGGSGATATVSCTGGAVVAVAVTSPGSGYTTAPTVSFTGGTGSGATAAATIVGDLTNPFTANIDGSWRIWAAIATGYDITMSGGVAPNSYAQPRTITNIFPNAFGGTSYTIIQANGVASAPVSPVNFINSSQVTFSISANQISAAIAAGTVLALQHAGVAVTDQSLMNWWDSPSSLSGGSLDSGYQPVIFKTDAIGGWAAETLATSSLATFSTPPLAGQFAIAYPTGFSTTCATGSNTSGTTKVTNGGCNSMVTWTFSAPGGNITTTSGATIPFANVTAVYPFVISASTIQSGNATPSNFFETTCTGTGLTLDNTRQGIQSGTVSFPLQQYTSGTSLTVSLANYNAMTCDISATEIDGSVGTPNIVNGNATLVGAYIYYTGTPVSSPYNIFVQGPLQYSTYNSTLSLPLPYDVSFDVGADGTQYVSTNSNFTSAASGILVRLLASHANTSTAPTFNLNGWGAWTIFGPTGGAIALNDITPNAGASGTGQVLNLQLTQTSAGMQWWLQNPKTEGGSGGVTGSGTANTLTKWTGTSTVGNSSITDDGVNPTRIPYSIDTNSIYREYTVDTGGVTAGQALCVTTHLDGGGQPEVLACPTTSHGAGFVGFAYSNIPATGLVMACWSVGCSALFDGTVTQRDTAIVSTTVAGDMHDTGSTAAPGGENLVVNISGPNSGVGTKALVNVTGATPAGGGGSGLPGGVNGQVPTNNGSGTGSYTAQSPTVGVANGGAAITTSYTLLCDSATVSVGIQDRGKWAVVGTGGSVTIPDLSGTGCSGFYGGVQNSTSGAITVSRQTTDTFNVYGPTQGAPSTGQTSFSLPAGSWATFNPSTSATAYDVRIGTPPAATSSTVSVNGSSVSNPNFANNTGAGEIDFTNPSGSTVNAALHNTSTTVNGVACTLGSTCTVSASSGGGYCDFNITSSSGGSLTCAHNLSDQYPQWSCTNISGATCDQDTFTWTDTNDLLITSAVATHVRVNLTPTTTAFTVTTPSTPAGATLDAQCAATNSFTCSLTTTGSADVGVAICGNQQPTSGTWTFTPSPSLTFTASPYGQMDFDGGSDIHTIVYYTTGVAAGTYSFTCSNTNGNGNNRIAVVMYKPTSTFTLNAAANTNANYNAVTVNTQTFTTNTRTFGVFCASFNGSPITAGSIGTAAATRDAYSTFSTSYSIGCESATLSTPQGGVASMTSTGGANWQGTAFLFTF